MSSPGSRLALPVVLATAALAGACGFQPAGSSAHLPPAMQVTYISSGQPYGQLENLLRRAIQAEGYRVVEDPRQATATLFIMSADQQRRVLAVNAQAQPQEYAVTYTVQYRLEDGSGRELLSPTTIRLTRDLAYSVSVELGAARRQQELLANMQREASRLILLRLEALGRAHRQPAAPAAPAATRRGPAPELGPTRSNV